MPALWDEGLAASLAILRWRADGSGSATPDMVSHGVTFLTPRNPFQCHTKHPKRQFSIKVGTIFEDSPIGLEK